MSLLLFTISIILGLNLKSHPIIVSGLFLFILIVLIKKKRFLVLSLLSVTLLTSFGISFISFHHDFNKYEGIVVESKENYFIVSSNLERFYVYSKDNVIEIGDYVSIEGKSYELSFNTIESSFDFKSYLNRKGIFYEIKSTSITQTFFNPIRIKKRQKEFLSHFSSEHRSTISSLLFALQEEDDDLSIQTNNLHISRILNLSGIHIYAFIWLFTTLFSFVFKKKKWVSLLAILFLSTFFIFTFPKFVVLRILSLYVIRYINRYFLKNRLTYLHTLSISCLFFILFDRYLALQDSLLLGYLFPLFIYLLRNSFHYIKGIKQKLLISGASYLFFIPFEISYFHEINILLTPISLLLSPLAILTSISSLLCFFHIPIYGFVEWLSLLFKGAISFFNTFNISIYMSDMNEVLILIYFVVLSLLLYFISIKFKIVTKYALISFLSILIIHSLPIGNLISNEVSFVNVGQGDCTLIRKNNHVILVDTGGLTYMDVARESLIPYFKKKKIYQIDKVIITHQDNDHTGALDNLKKYFRVKEVITEKTSFPFIYQGITFNNYNVFDYSSSDENYNSLVVGFKLQDISYLIMGDAPKQIEYQIMDNYSSISCDILKVGHHGSNTSTSEDFIKYLHPKVGIISCGKNNYYGHPHKEVISILNKYNVQIRRTDLEGSITYYKYSIL